MYLGGWYGGHPFYYWYTMKSVVVITPTTGDPKLADAIESVANQTYPNVKHAIVVDGDQFTFPLRANHGKLLPKHQNIEVVQLKQNTGGNGFYGHRVFAGFPHLVNEDIILFLDQDNWYKEDHVQKIVDTIEAGNDFAYSLRGIYNAKKEFQCLDNCESLGKWPVWNDQKSFLVDTSAYGFKREWLILYCQLWHWGYAGDRRFFNIVKDNVPNLRYACTGSHTLCYRLDGNPNSVSPAFFEHGNEQMKNRYDILIQEFPWLH